MPRQSVINLIGACLGRAQRRYPIRIHWFECNLHHLHVGFSIEDEAMRENVVPFFRMVQSGIARQTNRLWSRENHVFGERYRAAPCLDDAAAEQQLLYALANTVKDGQVKRVDRSPFFSTYPWHRIDGASDGPRRFWYIDYAGWWRKGGPRKGNRLEGFLEWVDVGIAPLPHLRALSAHQRQTRLGISFAKSSARRRNGSPRKGDRSLDSKRCASSIRATARETRRHPVSSRSAMLPIPWCERCTDASGASSCANTAAPRSTTGPGISSANFPTGATVRR